ncbi:MAG: efflux RND transporter periplasmic adaptor subunit [Gemmatimonadota bacterium]
MFDRGWERVGSLAGAALAVSLLAACGDADASAEGGGFGGGGPPGMPVRVAEAFTDTVVDAILATGEIEAVQFVELRPEVSGRLTQILVPEGTFVGRGRALFKVDDLELKAQVAQLEAQRDLAQQALQRTRDLLARNASSTADLEQAEANARSTQAQLDLQQTRLSRTVVRAPFSGIVGERFVSLGDYVSNATRLTTLQTVDPQRAVFQVPERYAGQLASGQRMTFRVAAVPEREFAGIVDFVDPLVQLPGRTITVKAQVPNTDGSLRRGMFIEARLATAIRPEAVVVPEDALLPLQGQVFVWTVTPEGTASRKEVEIGVRMPGYAEIMSGIEAGEQVIVGGVEMLGEGAPVMPLPPAGAGMPPGAEGAPGAGGAPGGGPPTESEAAAP